MLLVYGLFALLLAHLGVRAPTPYVQDAILNLRHPHIVIAVVMTDKYSCACNVMDTGTIFLCMPMECLIMQILL